MSPAEFDSYIVGITKESQDHFEPCLLCKLPTRGRGLFLPNEPSKWGAAKGKTRVFLYAICDDHAPLTLEIDAQIEDEIRRRHEDGTMDIMTSA